MVDLASRMNHAATNHVRRASKRSRSSVARAFGREVDYAMLVKIYGNQGSVWRRPPALQPRHL